MNINDIRVLLVAALPPPPGGDSTWAEEYIKYSQMHGYSLDVVNTAIIGKRSQNANDSFLLLDEIKRSIGIWKGIWKTLKKSKPDLVHMNSNCSPVGLIRDYISSCIIKAKKVPLIAHCHTNVGFKLKDRKLGILFLKKFLNNAQTVIALNSTSYNYVVGKVKTPVVIIPNFVDSSYILKDIRRINDDIGNIVYIGHVKREKGIEELLSVARHFKKLSFYIVGPVTEHYQDYIPEANVKLTGAVGTGEVKKFLRECDLFIFPTYSEGFSIALLEAMANGIPIIATNVGANSDMLEESGGIIVEPMNSDMIIEAVNKLYDKKVRQDMSEWNLNKVKTCYTIDIIMDQIRELYLKIIDDGKKIEGKGKINC